MCPPVWLFVDPDGGVFSICEKDFKSKSYQHNVIEVINIETQQSFTPQQIFGEKIAKF